MSDSLSKITEAERIKIAMKAIEIDAQKISGEIAEIEVKMNEAQSRKSDVETLLGEKAKAYKKFLDDLPDNLDPKKIDKIASERVDQLAEEGLLEDLAERPQSKPRGRKSGTKNSSASKNEQPAKKHTNETNPVDPIEELASEESNSGEMGDTSPDNEFIADIAPEGESEISIEIPEFLKD